MYSYYNLMKYYGRTVAESLTKLVNNPLYCRILRAGPSAATVQANMPAIGSQHEPVQPVLSISVVTTRFNTIPFANAFNNPASEQKERNSLPRQTKETRQQANSVANDRHGEPA